MYQTLNQPSDRSELTHKPLDQSHYLMVDQSRQAILMQAMRATEEDSSPEALQAFSIYCERHYLPEEIARASQSADR